MSSSHLNIKSNLNEEGIINQKSKEASLSQFLAFLSYIFIIMNQTQCIQCILSNYGKDFSSREVLILLIDHLF